MPSPSQSPPHLPHVATGAHRDFLGLQIWRARGGQGELGLRGNKHLWQAGNVTVGSRRQLERLALIMAFLNHPFLPLGR